MAAPLLHVLRTYWLWSLVAVAGTAAFMLAPGGIGDKSRTLLHGLCAQTPSHTFTFGGQLLPFDARMTGIYGGVAVALAFLVARGRLLRWGTPPVRVTILLAAFVVAMAADGFNSLFTDLGLWHPWESRNELRLITGYLTGVSLGVTLSWLLGSTLYRMGSRQPGVQSPREVGVMVAGLLPYAVVVMSGATWLYAPLALVLVLSGWLTMSLLALAIVVLALRLDDRVTQLRHLHVPAAVAGIAGLAIMLVLALGRMWLERTFGIPSTL